MRVDAAHTQSEGGKNDAPSSGYRAEDFEQAIAKSRSELSGLVPRFVTLLVEILNLRQSLLVLANPYPGMDRDLADLIPPHFLQVTPFVQLAHFPRYLKALKARAERAKQNPLKDAERAARVAPYTRALAALRTTLESQKNPGQPTQNSSVRERIDDFRWLVEEFRVSVFAQELGTAQPVSEVKLDRALADLKQRVPATASAAKPAAATPRKDEPVAYRPIPTTAEKKTAPLKNLSALDRLFPRSP